MNKKILFLGAIISSCVIAFISGQTMADYRNPNMPTSGYKCYDGSSSYGPFSKGSSAQQTPYSYGYTSPEMGGAGAKQLQADSAEKYTGTVSSLNRVQYPDGTQIEMILDTDNGTKRIMLGPSKFVEQSKVKVQSGDKVTVTGYRIGANGNEVIVAQEINKNGFVLQLRSDQRQPMWSQPSYMYGGSQSMTGPNRSSPYAFSNNQHPLSPVNRGY